VKTTNIHYHAIAAEGPDTLTELPTTGREWMLKYGIGVKTVAIKPLSTTIKLNSKLGENIHE